MGLKVRELIEDLSSQVNFQILIDEGLDNQISEFEVNRPGLALAGFFEYFGYKRLQLLGKGEVAYLKHLSQWALKQTLLRMFEHKIPCFVVSWNLDLPEEFLKLAKENKVPILKTSLPTGKINAIITLYLEEKFAPKEILHGNLVDVYGVGVIIKGESGVGKSEVALELIKRGHRFVADDTIEAYKIGHEIIGKAPSITRYRMEIRGIGIIDVRRLFGMSAICEKKEINLVADLVEEKEINRLGLENDEFEILGIKIPKISIPVHPSRDIATLVEIGAMNHRLKIMGYDSTKEFDKEIKKILSGGNLSEGSVYPKDSP